MIKYICITVFKIKGVNMVEINNLRRDFGEYYRNCYPNDKNPHSSISMAFFLERHGDELGMDLKKILLEKKIPGDYKQKLETYFINCGRKNPRGNASIYYRALQLLLDCLDGKKPLVSKKSITEVKQKLLKSIVSQTEIPKPTKQKVS